MPGNGKITTAAIEMAGKGDNWVKLVTLVLIIVSGALNWTETRVTSNDARDKAIAEIHQLYSRVDEFESRQKLSLQNQTKLLENQAEILEQLKANQSEFLRRKDVH